MPDKKEQKWIDSIRERWGQSALVEKFRNSREYCVCSGGERHFKGRRQGRQRSGPGWLRKPFKVIAVLAVKYPRLAVDRKDNLKARRDSKLVTDWINGKRLTDRERRRVRYLTEFGDKEGQGEGVGSGSFLFQKFKLVMPGWGETNLSELLDSPRINERGGMFGRLLGLGKRKIPTGRAVARFLRYLVHNPEIVIMVKTGMLFDLEPFGFDLDGMKQKLYENHPEFRAALDGMLDGYGYDECEAVIKALPEGFGAAVSPDSFEDDWPGWLESTGEHGLKNWEYVDGMAEVQAYDPEFESAFFEDRLENYSPEKIVHVPNIFEHLLFPPHDLPSPRFSYEYPRIRERCWKVIFSPSLPNPRSTERIA